MSDSCRDGSDESAHGKGRFTFTSVDKGPLEVPLPLDDLHEVSACKIRAFSSCVTAAPGCCDAEEPEEFWLLVPEVRVTLHEVSDGDDGFFPAA